MSADERLNCLIEPGRTSSNPKANYRNATRWGDLVFVSGKSANGAVGGKAPHGRLGDTLTLADGVAFAREAALELLLVLRDELGSLDKVRQVLDLHHAKVLDGASDVLAEVLGEAGVHARSVFGAVSLRGGQPVILRAVVGVSA
jgi:enamine deaminase RidA (YjgF/YER057c/UK114 family)